MKLQTAAGVLGILGFGISVTLAWLRIRETFFLRADIDAKWDWIESEAPIAFTFVLFNKGSAKGSVVNVLLGTDDGAPAKPWTPQRAIWERLPLTLGPNEASARFVIQAHPSSSDPAEVALRERRITRLLIETPREPVKEIRL